VTTLEGLKMGVPVVTLNWPTLVGRLSASILTTLGLTDWIANSREDYVRLAADKARDLAALSQVRATLRERFDRSVIGDNAAYVAAVEAEYRQLWLRWCGRQTPDATAIQ
jgi:predicted O-linked N-acetylglucosamine transferase (SPINDLY family)